MEVQSYQDENRYYAGRGAHINLKRAERARITVSKIPGIAFCKVFITCQCAMLFVANGLLFSAIVDNLISRTLAWEEEKKGYFLYDGVSCLLEAGIIPDMLFIGKWS